VRHHHDWTSARSFEPTRLPCPTRKPAPFRPQPFSHPDLASRFRIYESVPGYSPIGAVIAGVLMIIGAIALGAVFGWVMESLINLIIVMPALMAGGLAGVAMAAARLGKLRHIGIGAAIGVVAGIIMFVASMQVRASVAVGDDGLAELRQAVADAPEELSAEDLMPLLFHVDQMNQEEEAQMLAVIRFLRNPGMFSYMSMEASFGLTITSSRSSSDSGGLNLGSAGQWIYWILELIVFLAAGGVGTAAVTNTPFCTLKDGWKSRQKLPRCVVNPPRFAEALETGNLPALADSIVGPAPPKGSWPTAGKMVVDVNVYLGGDESHRETGEGESEIEVKTVSPGKKKNEESTSALVMVTVPNSAVPAVMAVLEGRGR
jgi:hypothetical protein